MKKRFNGVVYKLTNPKASFLIYANGKILMNGVRNLDDNIIASDKLAKILQPDNPLKVNNLKINNIAFSACYGRPLNLYRLHGKILEDRRLDVHLEFELFPALRCYLRNTKMCIIIFHSGKCILTGSISEEDINNLFFLVKFYIDSHLQ